MRMCIFLLRSSSIAISRGRLRFMRISVRTRKISSRSAGCSGSRTLHGQSEPEITTHFTGRVRLATGQCAGEKESRKPPPEKAEKVGADQMYRVFFHGPAYQVIDSAWRTGDSVIGIVCEKPAGKPRAFGIAASLRLRGSSSCASRRPVCRAWGFNRAWACPMLSGSLKLLSAPENAPDADILFGRRFQSGWSLRRESRRRQGECVFDPAGLPDHGSSGSDSGGPA